MKKLLNFFASLRLTVFLIFLIAILSSLGTFLPQGEDAAGLADKWGPGVFHALQALGLTDTYHSWWFVLALMLIAANLIACTIKRLPKVWRLHERTEESVLRDDDIPKSSFTERWESSLTPDQALGLAGGVLARKFGNLRQLPGGDSKAVWGEKHVISLWGAYIVHLGLMFLLTGGLLGVVFGYSKYLAVLEGETKAIPKVDVRFKPGFYWATVPGTSWQVMIPSVFDRHEAKENFELKLNRFDVQYYPGSMAPKEFRSDVELWRGEKAFDSRSIRVNEPMILEGVRFYQSSYGYDGANAVRFDVHLPKDPAVYEVWAPYQKRFALQKTGWSLEVTDFYPDATMAGPGKIVRGSGQLNNPAVRVAFYKGKELKTHFWTFFAFPEINASKIPGLAVEAKNVDPIAYTVLQVNHDPGVPFALAGALIVILGVILSFYMFYQKVWVVVRPRQGSGSLIELVGVCKRNKLTFKNHFVKLHAEMKAALPAS